MYIYIITYLLIFIQQFLRQTYCYHFAKDKNIRVMLLWVHVSLWNTIKLYFHKFNFAHSLNPINQSLRESNSWVCPLKLPCLSKYVLFLTITFSLNVLSHQSVSIELSIIFQRGKCRYQRPNPHQPTHETFYKITDFTTVLLKLCY